MGSLPTPARDASGVPCSLQRAIQLACFAFDVPVAWATVDGALYHATSFHPKPDGDALGPRTLRAVMEAASSSGSPVCVERAADARGIGQTELKFVAIVPLLSASAHRIGSFCIADHQPRTLDDAEREHLKTLASMTETCLHLGEDMPSSQHLHRVVQQTDHGIVVTDPDTRITWVNEGFEQLCGYARDELQGRKPRDLLQGPRTDEQVTATIREHVQAGEGFSAELINYRKSGEPYWVHIEAEPIVDETDRVVGFFALETDVSERKALEEALRIERDLLATIIDTVEALVVIVDAEARIVRFNEACRRVTGRDSADVIGERVTDMLIDDEERARVEAAMDAHRAGQQQTSFECHWMTQSGERRLIDWTNTMVTDTEGDVQYILGTGIDITERRQLEQQIIQVSEEERRRIGQDLHDILSSQLAGTAMMAKSLRQQLGQGRDVTADALGVVVCQIQKASNQARALSHSLMPACIEGRSLDEALRQLAENKQELTGVPHTVEAGPDLPRIDEAIAVHLYRIAYEAINNAVKHAEPSSIQIRLVCTDEVLVVEVCDDGIGIPSELDPVEGLGLHMMHHRADVIGAQLRIYPGEDGGTTVRCELPLEKTANASLNE